MKILIIFFLSILSLCDVPGDIVNPVPGYDPKDTTVVYSGYLDVKNITRSIHYVYVVSKKGINNNDPVTLWLNGGPGCSSMLGFLQEIGPYYLQEGKNYQKGDLLTLNNHSWHNCSNLLFFESPTRVGYSLNNDSSFVYNDTTTLEDNFNALIDFFTKFKQYSKNKFWIAGESYAGKYIPDLAVKIDMYNEKATFDKIDLRGIMVGNGVMSYHNGRLFDNMVEYMIDHYFTDPDLYDYWQTSCKRDRMSAGCRFFEIRFREDTDQLNPYSVYGYCYYNDSTPGLDGKHNHKFDNQQSRLHRTVAQALNYTLPKVFDGPRCSYFKGMYNYFTIHSNQYHSKAGDQKWNGPCVENFTYHISLAGSIESYQYLLNQMKKNYHLVLYNGDWDATLPYHDTVDALETILQLRPGYHMPLMDGDQHVGFTTLYEGITFVTIKGASHMAPQSKRREVYSMFEGFISGHNGTSVYGDTVDDDKNVKEIEIDTEVEVDETATE